MDTTTDPCTHLKTLVDHANRQAQATIPTDQTVEQRLGIPFNPGDRVFDTVTGEEGIVIAGTVQHFAL